MGRWETRHGNWFTTSGPYMASSEATQPVQEQFALLAVAHSHAEHIFWGSPGVLLPGHNAALAPGGGQALGNLDIRASQWSSSSLYRVFTQGVVLAWFVFSKEEAFQNSFCSSQQPNTSEQWGAVSPETPTSDDSTLISPSRQVLTIYQLPQVTNLNKPAVSPSLCCTPHMLWEHYPHRQSSQCWEKASTLHCPQLKLCRPMLFVTNTVLNHLGLLFETFSTKQNPPCGERGPGGHPGGQGCPSPGSWMHLWIQGECPQPSCAPKSLTRRSSPKGSM